MSKSKKQVVVLACSGIGKTFGALGREIVYEVVERLRPGIAVTTCLPLLMIEDVDAKKLVTENSVISIDGCPFDCARKSVESIGVTVSKSYRAINFYKAHKDLKPEGIVELNEAGQKLAAMAAEELAAEVDRLVAQGNE